MTRPRTRLAGLLFDAWRYLDRALDGVDEKEALEKLDGGARSPGPSPTPQIRSMPG